MQGKVALVTGGSRGIGRKIAETMAAEGAAVFLTARDEGHLSEASEAMGTTGARVAYLVGSTSDPDHIDAAVDQCVAELGRIDVLVNNAGTDVATSLLEPDWSQVEEMWRINYFGPWRFAQRAWVCGMKDHGGSIVSISSTAAAKARSIMAAYAMSKAALCDLTQRLAIDMAPKVRVNAIAPGIVPTDMVRELHTSAHGAPANVDEQGGPWPLRRLGTLDDVSSAALFLASDESSWITGQVLYVDGGAHLPQVASAPPTAPAPSEEPA